MPPEYLPTLARLADLFNVSTSAMRDLRARDPRFPPKGAQGYSVFALAHLLRARELEGMTDEDFNREHHEGARETLRQIEAGECPELDFPAAVEIMREVAAGRWDVDPATGRTAREEAIADALDAVRTFIERTPGGTPATADPP